MKNQKGSTIVTAMVIAMVLTILLGACFAIASSYHNRSIKNHQERQAYLTAMSIVDTISAKICANDNNYIPTDQPIEFPDIQLTNDTCEKRSATITLKQTNIIVIVASATNYGKTQTIQLTMEKKDSVWHNLQYSSEGEIVYENE